MTLWCAPEERHNEPYGIVYRLGMERNVDISLSDCTFHLHCSSLSLSLCISLSLCLCVCFCFDYLFISPIFSFYGVDKLRTQARGPTYLFLATHTVRQPRTSLHQRFPTPRLLYDASNSVIIRWTGGCQCAAATSKCWQLTRPRIASAPPLQFSSSSSLIMTNSWKFPRRQFTMIKHQILPPLSFPPCLSVSFCVDRK